MFGLSALTGLFGGGASASAVPDNTNQTATTGPVSFGSKYLGRGSVTSSDNKASDGATITAGAPGGNASTVYVVAGLAALALVALVMNRGK